MLPAGTALSRFLMVKALARGDAMRAVWFAETLTDTPQIKACSTTVAGQGGDRGWEHDRCDLGRSVAVYGVADEASTRSVAPRFSAPWTTNFGGCRFDQRAGGNGRHVGRLDW